MSLAHPYSPRSASLRGAAVALSDFADPSFVQALHEDCGLIVPEYELQWDRMRPTPRRTDWRRADALLELSQRQGLGLRGHAMLWHGALPNWFEALSPAGARRAALARISSLGRRYRGRVHSWDVVNEPLSETGEGLRGGPLLRAFGAGLLNTCFARAAQADPGTLLVLNEMGLEYGGAQADRKRDMMLHLLESELARGTPIGALGLQAHLDASDGPHDHQALRHFLRAVSGLGLPVMVTELDVSDRSAPAEIDARDDLVAEAARGFLAAVLEECDCRAVITWGLSDRRSWLAQARPRRDGLSVRPLPRDAALRTKPFGEVLGQLSVSKLAVEAPHAVCMGGGR